MDFQPLMTFGPNVKVYGACQTDPVDLEGLLSVDAVESARYFGDLPPTEETQPDEVAA